MPTIDDLTVCRKKMPYDTPEVFEVSSWLTRGYCATVSKSNVTGTMTVRPFLIPSYMQGITDSLLRSAVTQFLMTEQANKPKSASAKM